MCGESFLLRSAPARHRAPEARGDARAARCAARDSRSRWRAAARRWTGFPFCSCRRASSPDFKQLLDEDGNAGRRRLEDAAHATRCSTPSSGPRPDVLLIELFPFGRRQMRFELLPLLEAAASTKPQTPGRLLGARPDPAESGARGRRARAASSATSTACWCTATRASRPSSAASARRRGSPASCTTRDMWSRSMTIGRRCRRRRGPGLGGRRRGRAAPARNRDRRPAPLTALARPDLADPRRARTLQSLEQLAAQASEGVIVERARNDFTLRLRNCVLSVSQAGYNTVMETLQAGARAVLVPFAGGGESEQTLRARLLAERGLVHVVEEDVADSGDAGRGGRSRRGGRRGPRRGRSISAARAAAPSCCASGLHELERVRGRARAPARGRSPGAVLVARRRCRRGAAFLEATACDFEEASDPARARGDSRSRRARALQAAARRRDGAAARHRPSQPRRSRREEDRISRPASRSRPRSRGSPTAWAGCAPSPASDFSRCSRRRGTACAGIS